MVRPRHPAMTYAELKQLRPGDEVGIYMPPRVSVTGPPEFDRETSTMFQALSARWVWLCQPNHAASDLGWRLLTVCTPVRSKSYPQCVHLHGWFPTTPPGVRHAVLHYELLFIPPHLRLQMAARAAGTGGELHGVCR